MTKIRGDKISKGIKSEEREAGGYIREKGHSEAICYGCNCGGGGSPGDGVV